MGKTVVLFTSLILCIALVVPCFASTDLSVNIMGFYQVQNTTPPVYKRVGSVSGSGFQVATSQYDQGGMCWVGSRFNYPSADLPLDRDWIQLTFYMDFSATNVIPSEYRNDDFFPSIYWMDNSKTSSYDPIDYNAITELKPLRVTTDITSHSATLNIMLTKEQYIYSAGT